MWPGACAPSMMVRMPASRARRTSVSTGKVSAVGDVMWLRNSTRVFGVRRAQTPSMTWSGDSRGRGRRACTYRAPWRSQMNRHVLSSAPYSWSVVRISSPGPRARERATMFKPVVAFVT